MSLLNQVLLDLDARQPRAARPRLRTATPSVVRHAADDFADADWRRLLFPGAVVASVLFALLLAAWVFERTWHLAGQTGPAMHSQRLTLPEPARVPAMGGRAAAPVTAVAPRPAQAGATRPPATPEPALEERSNLATTPPADETYLPLRNATLADLPAEPAAPDGAAAAVPVQIPTKSIRPAPKDPLAPARRAIAAGELAEAEGLLTATLRREPQNLRARELLIGLMLRGERTGDALRQLDAGLAHHPAHGNFVLIKARLLAQSGDRPGAIALLERSTSIAAIGAQRLQMLGALYQQDGRFAEAAEHYRALLAIQPNSAAGWVGVAISLDARGDDDAAAAYRRALRAGGLPSSAEAYARGRLAELE